MNVKLLLISSVITATIGQILFKKGMSIVGAQNITLNVSSALKTFITVIFNPYVFLGLIFYGLSTFIWLGALSKTQLNYAYPFTALTFILVMLAAHFIFGEVLPTNRLLGVGLICAGIIVTGLK
jgi:multidrug transporter EmrE-like cation transporter